MTEQKLLESLKLAITTLRSPYNRSNAIIRDAIITVCEEAVAAYKAKPQLYQECALHGCQMKIAEEVKLSKVKHD